jgi:tetratricopeptide (TPR) repeat protein
MSEVDKLFAMLRQNDNSTQQHYPNLAFENEKQQIFSVNESSVVTPSTVDIADECFERGFELLEAGDFERAIASFDQALKIKPDLYKAWYDRGIALRKLGRFEEVIVSYDKAIEFKPDYYEAWTNRGIALRKLGRLEEAVASYDKAIEIKPNGYEAWGNRGFALHELGRLEEAIVSYDKIIELKPDDYEAWYSRGGALSDLGRLEQAIESIDKALEIKPDNYEACYSRGLVLSDLGRLEQEIESYDQALKFKPDYYEACYSKGIALANLGRLEQAIESIDKALEIKPDDHRAWYNRGLVLSDLGRLKQAIESYDNAIQFKPDDHRAWYNRGLVLNDLGRLEQAIESYHKALEIKPDKEEAWHSIGYTLGQLGRLEEAIASYDKAIGIKPDYHEVWNSRGVALSDLGRIEQAIVSYDKAIEIKPDKYGAWINRGIAAGQSISFNPLFASSSPIATKNPALNQRGYEGRLASFQEGLKYCQQDTHPEGWGQLHKAIGKAHYFQGKGTPNYREYWHKAETEYHQALITLTPEAFPELHLELLQDLIRVLFGLKKDDEAKQWRRQALEVFAQLVNSPNKSSFQKRKLAAKFSGISPMRVDFFIEDSDFVTALETAERDKNFHLIWILDHLKEDILSPSYSEIQELVNPQNAPNTAIIYWHFSPHFLTTFIIQPDGDKPIVIPTQKPDKLEAWIKNWDEQYDDYRKSKKEQPSNPAWRDNLPQLLTQLSEIINIPYIIESIENSNVSIQNLILIPHRDLHRFPLHALFPDNFTINYLPSAEIGLSLNSQPQNSQQDIINPNLLIVQYSGLGREDEGLQMLKEAQIESETIARIFANNNPKYISDCTATKNTVKQALAAGYNIFHFSGHGSYDNKHPINSALYLNKDSANAEANPDLTLPEIRNLNLSSYQLVSLSSCETAITGYETIEKEYVGLMSAFLYQGVSHVVSTLWTVNEISTALLMIYFYRQISKGKTPNIALEIAIEWLRNLTYKKLNKLYKISFNQLGEEDSSLKILQTEIQSLENKKGKLFDHPYYWAGFIIAGV